jgi:hypothetical protein
MLGYIVTFLIIFLIVLFFIYSRLKSSDDIPMVSGDIDDRIIFEVQVSRHKDDTEKGISLLAAENMFAALHGLLKDDPSMQEHISFEVNSRHKDGIKFFCAVPRSIAKYVQGQIYAHFPKSQIKVVDDPILSMDFEDKKYKIASLELSKPYFFPIKTYKDFETDPLSSFTSTLSEVLQDEELYFQMMVKPIPDIWQQQGYDYADSVRDGTLQKKNATFVGNVFRILTNEAVEISKGVATGLFVQNEHQPVEMGRGSEEIIRLTPTQELELQLIENKLSKMGYAVVIRIFSKATTIERVESNIRSMTASLKQYTGTAHNTFEYKSDINSAHAFDLLKSRYFDSSREIILNTEELGTIYHFPSPHMDTPSISWVYSRKSEPPAELPTEDCVYIADTLYRNRSIRFGMRNDDDRLRHMYVIGKTGVGKSTLYLNMAIQDIYNGLGVAVLDPHGETIENILERIPDHRVKDVIYFDPSDDARPIGLNLLEMEDPSQKNLMADGLVSAIKQHFDYSWGPRLEYLLNYAILTLLEVPGTTMLGITRLLEDKNYLNYILHQVKDPLVIKFWEKEYRDMKGNQKLVTEAIAPIQNKVNRFLASTTIRNILGQRNSTLDLWDAMNSGKIVLMNLSKGKVGAENANLLGALLVSRIQFYALQRARIPYEERNPYYLYVDEFQNFATGSFEEILSESRKYKLGLYLTHQFTAQLSDDMLKAVLGNVGTVATFSLGAQDANIMAKEFSPYFTADDIISLEKFQIYMKLMIGGMTSVPFSASILLPWSDDYPIKSTGNKQKAINHSRDTYGVDKEYIESKINKWIEFKFDKGMAIAEGHKEKNPEAENEKGDQDLN